MRTQESPGQVFRQPDPDTRLIRRLIWCYFWLWFAEGAVRKWLLPQYSGYLLLVRDPLVIWIYILAFFRLRFRPLWPWLATGVFSVVMGLEGAFSPVRDPLVALYGLRTNLLHVPMIFVIGQVFTYDEVSKVARYALALAFPLVAIAVAQFYSPLGSFINAGAGTDSGQLEGALGHVRPPSVFSFNGGYVAFLNLTLVFALEDLMVQHGRRLLFAASAFAVLMVGFAVSVSRAAVLGGGITLAVFMLTSARNRGFGRFLAILYCIPAALASLSFLGVVHDGMFAFAERWTGSTSDLHTTVYESIVLRIWHTFTDFLQLLGRTPAAGYGLGLGTNAGAFLLTGDLDFLLAENEFERVILEVGPIVGTAYILFRFAIAGVIGAVVVRAFRRGNPRPWCLFSVSAVTVLIGQWGVATIQGATVLLAGLTLASAHRRFPAGAAVPPPGRQRRMRIPIEPEEVGAR
jgi:hypothetical protein